jgi:hypothetical protein
MMLNSFYIPEPLLEFGYGQKVEHPQDGLFLYGPIDVPGSPQILRIGVIGTATGNALMARWLGNLKARCAVKDPTKLHTLAWPGFQAALGARLEVEPLATINLSLADIELAVRKGNRTDAVRSTVRLYEDALLEHKRSQETRLDVWPAVLLEIIHTYGRPTAGPRDRMPSDLMPVGQLAKYSRKEICFLISRRKREPICSPGTSIISLNARCSIVKWSSNWSARPPWTQPCRSTTLGIPAVLFRSLPRSRGISRRPCISKRADSHGSSLTFGPACAM